jgi:Zn-finger nucleic acid-binding protein
MICPKCKANDSRRFLIGSKYIEIYVCPRCANLWEVFINDNYVQLLNKGGYDGTDATI